MSGIESLVTQVKPGQEPGQQKPTNQLVITVEEPEQKPVSCWSRFLCCGSQTNKTKTTSSAPPSVEVHHPKVETYVADDNDSDNLSIDIDDIDCRLPNRKYLLSERPPREQYKKTLVLDLDETLVHSSFKEIDDADFEININLEGVIHRVFVRKRPGVDHFLTEVGKKWEVVIFTASLAKYADPLLDKLDVDRVVDARLFRESCVSHFGNYVKDLTTLGRNPKNCVIIDNSPMSYMFQPHHAVPITTWFHEKDDMQLYDLLPLLDKMADCEDVRDAIADSSHLFVDGGIVRHAVVPNFRMAPPRPQRLTIPQTPNYKGSNGNLMVIQPPETPSTPHVNNKTGRSVLNSPMAGSSRR